MLTGQEEVSAVSPVESERIGEPVDRVTAPDEIQDAILSLVGGGTTVVGTIGSFSRAWGVTVSELRSALRQLLESDRIALQIDAHGRLVIREGRPVRAPRVGPAPARPCRSHVPDVWIV